MRHIDCMNYICLDCEKGQCALSKQLVPIDGEGSESCSSFVQTKKCGFCKNFEKEDDHGIGVCTGFEKENWVYASCGAFGCSGYQAEIGGEKCATERMDF